ncbi:MAG: hypothetical protein C4547_12075 [Phycisphaerales bacterium]|nr:MAG: hypothetical protein C4547_12075 [Phycisphaerales bacterium]
MGVSASDTDQTWAVAAAEPADALARAPLGRIASARARRTHWDFWIAVAACLLAAAAYVLYQRVGTRANADRVFSFESLRDDTVKIGLTDEQPGFVLLGRLPESLVSIDAQVRSNWLTGRQTFLRIATPTDHVGLRLRGPLAVLVQRDGSIASTAIPWSREDFAALLHTADCATDCVQHKHRCGQPLTEIARTLAQWPADRVPPLLRTFLDGQDEPAPAAQE